MKTLKLYRTIIRFEIISEEPILHTPSLGEIEEETTNGQWSGMALDNEKSNEVLEGEAAVIAVKSQGSDPSFFIMDEDDEY